MDAPADDAKTLGTREARRRGTEAAILVVARRLFAERGFERTTVRAVASDAEVDPALVLKYFGSKDGLFAAAAAWGVPLEDLTRARREELPEAALRHVFDAFEDPGSRDATVALLRSSLTHPAALAVLRDRVMAAAQAGVAESIDGPDAALRAGLLNACTLGLSIARYLLVVPAVAEADRADVERLLAPALEALVRTENAE